MKKILILGSSSKSRIKLLQQINLTPDIIISPEIDETPLKKEGGRILSKRLAIDKNIKILSDIRANNGDILKTSFHKELFKENKFVILTADTVSVKGSRILEKSFNQDEIKKYLSLLSGGSHRVYTSISCFDAEKNKLITKTSESRIKMKRLTKEEIDYYISIKEGEGMAGGYSVDGYAGRFVEKIIGSHSGICGLDLNIAFNLLHSCSFGFCS